MSDTLCQSGALTALTEKFTIHHCQMGIMRHRSAHNRYSAAYAMGREFGEICQNRSDRECQDEGMRAARQRLRRFGRTTGTRTRTVSSDCIVRTVSFGADPHLTGTGDEKIYHCGASSKDGGNRVMTIELVSDRAIYRPLVEKLLLNPNLVLKG